MGYSNDKNRHIVIQDLDMEDLTREQLQEHVRTLYKDF